MQNQSSAENNGGDVDHHVCEVNDEIQETIEVVTVQEFSQLLELRRRCRHIEPTGRRQIHLVQPQLQLTAPERENVYHPVMVSIGPYHHEKPELCQAEEFKDVCLDWYAGGDQERMTLFYNKILEIIRDIRDHYAEVSIVKKYDNKALALMMLLDACFIINFMHITTKKEGGNNGDWNDYFGAAWSIRFTSGDILVLGNQIPLRVIKVLISLQNHEQVQVEDRSLVRFISWLMRMDLKQVEMATETYKNEEPPLHILEACWRVLAVRPNNLPNQQVRNSKFSFMRRNEKDAPQTSYSDHVTSFMRRKMEECNAVYTCCSVMDLKAKGIHLSPSSSHYLEDITYKSHVFYGQLQLPVQYVSEITPVILSNMIAYEVSQKGKVRPVMLSFVNFVKALIESPEDVKELQEMGILLNRFVNHEQIVKMCKVIDTSGLVDPDIFREVKQRIEEHCSCKAKTWIGDLIHTRFRTPWTAIALFAAVFLLCLTFLQTLFTILPVK